MEWIPVANQLPKDSDGDYVLIWGEDDGEYPDLHKAYLGSDNCFYYEGIEYTNVTHWMPLPKPPIE